MHNLDNDFWTFSLAVYRQPNVAPQCLEIQEQLSANVNALLFCAWVGSAFSLQMDPADIAALRAANPQWHDPVVRPLRGVRSYIKTMAGDDDILQALRQKVKALELHAEQIEQARLFAARDSFTRHATKADRTAAIRGNVAAYLEALTADLDRPPSPAPDAGHIVNAAIGQL